MLLIGFFSVISIFSIFTYLIFSGLKKDIVSKDFITLAKRYVDMAKGFSYTSLIYSSNMATIDIAGQGGYISDSGSPRTWVCNQLLIPYVSEVNWFLSNRTVNYLNKYSTNFNTEMKKGKINITITNFTCGYYDVSENSVYSGINDERFNVSGFGSFINVTYSNNYFLSSNNQFATVSQNRFWFLYRGLSEWLRSSGYKLISSSVCSCLPTICYSNQPNYVEECKIVNNPFCNCIKGKLSEIKNSLNSYFRNLDGGKDYIDCKVHLLGCFNKKKECPLSTNNNCISWNRPDKCYSCFLKQPGKNCIQNIFPDTIQGNNSFYQYGSSVYTSFTNEKNISNYLKNNGDGEIKHCNAYDQVYGSIEALISCEDRKYFISAPDRTISFEIHIRMALQKTDCYKTFECKKNYETWVPDPRCCTGCY